MKSYNKYKNAKITVDGIVFHSHKEAARYKQLSLMEKAGEIVDLELQPSFILQKSFKYNGETIRAIKYIADFKYIDIKTSRLIVEDVKGFKKDKTYIIKKKIFLFIYGNDVTFMET